MAVLFGPKIIQMIGASLGDAYLSEGNLFLRGLQALLQCNFISFLDDPPSSPNNGDTYIIGTGTGAWAGKDNQIAYWTTQNLSTAAWDFWTPVEGWKTYNQTTNATMKFDGSVWVTESASGITLQTDGVDNADQSILNLVDVNITSDPFDLIGFVDKGSGAVSGQLISFNGTGTFGGAGGTLDFTLDFAYPTAADYTVYVSYVYPTVAPGILSVEYVDNEHFKIHSSSATDASSIRYRVL